MDDRFYTEGSNHNENAKKPLNNNTHNSEKISSPGNFSGNIESKFNNAQTKASAPKKFEVHIADFDMLPKTEAPEYHPYGEKYSEQKKSAAKPSVAAANNAEKAKPVKSESQKKLEGTMVFNTAKKSTYAKREVKKAPVANRKAAPGRTAGTQRISGKTPAKPNKITQSANKRASAKENSRYNFIKGVLVICVCVIFITIMTVTASTVALSTINDILVVEKNSGNPVSVEIPAGADFDQVFEILKDNGLIKQPLVTKLFCKFRNYHEVTKTDENGDKYVAKIEYEAGNYFLDANVGIEAMLEEIMVRNNVAKDTVRLTFPEGWTIAKIFAKIESSNVCSADKLYANLEIVGEQYGFIEEIGMVSGRYLKAEGYLFPDTYDFFIGENASSVLKKLFSNFETRWTQEYADQLSKLGMSMDEIITIASIIQREAKDSTQMKDISSVIHNRLDNAASYPTIDMNSTKDYVVSLKEYQLFSDFYYDLYLDAYNTYSNQGLPPGPICSPGKAAIEAALFPSDTDYNFFCHSETGEVYYAVTAAEHQQNTNKIIYGN